MERDTDPNMYKVWTCLFTCASSRRVHIDLVPDLTVEAFVRCLEVCKSEGTSLPDFIR